MTISLVLFDMDDVLCHYGQDARVKTLSTLSDRTSAQAFHRCLEMLEVTPAETLFVDDLEANVNWCA